jgi:Fic family protein
MPLIDDVLLCPQEEKADREILNQKAVVEYLGYFLDSGRTRITEADILELHRLTINGIYPCAGRYRDARIQIRIVGSRHIPAEPSRIRFEIADMLTWHYGAGQKSSEFTRAAQMLWKINAIHPFAGGNGRVARAACYLVVVSEIAPLFAGVPLPAKLKTRKPLYIANLQAGDRGNLIPLTELIEECVREQVADAVQELTETFQEGSAPTQSTERMAKWFGRKLIELVKHFSARKK